MEDYGRGIVKTVESKMSSPPSSLLSEEEVSAKVEQYMALLGNAIDSPLVQLILRNIVLTLLELPEHEFTIGKAYALVTEEQARIDSIFQLTKGTPQYWSKDWDLLWKKDADPLLSKSQQRAASRIRLATFWSTEWMTMPSETRTHVVNLLRSLMRRRDSHYLSKTLRR